MPTAIVYFGRYEPLPALRIAMLTRVGYAVERAGDQAKALDLVRQRSPALVIIDEAIPHNERAAVSSEAKREGAFVLGMHRGERLGSEDNNLGTVVRPQDFLRSVSKFIMRSHGHEEIAGQFVAYVDKDRQYRFVSDEVCHLLGYTSEELLSRKIDDVTMPETADTPQLFQQYLADGTQTGTYVLRHRDGHAVPIRYRARVFDDGCMAAQWEPLVREDAA
jgi:PAS domain S-box-containing protein